jgi:hypothetical protein
MIEIKLQAPNHKYQISSKSQVPNLKQILCPLLQFGILDLGFVWNLEFGVWSFGGHE